MQSNDFIITRARFVTTTTRYRRRRRQNEQCVDGRSGPCGVPRDAGRSDMALKHRFCAAGVYTCGLCERSVEGRAAHSALGLRASIAPALMVMRRARFLSWSTASPTCSSVLVVMTPCDLR